MAYSGLLKWLLLDLEVSSIVYIYIHIKYTHSIYICTYTCNNAYTYGCTPDMRLKAWDLRPITTDGTYFII